VEEFVERKRPRESVEEKRGEAKILKIFSKGKGEQVVGGEVKSGSISKKQEFRIMRRGEVIGTGKIKGLQKEKRGVESVNQGSQFGARVSYSIEIAEGDRIETYEKILK
jgi:translation initiation factor IF-2